MYLHSLYKKMIKFIQYSYTIIKYFPEYRFDIFGVLFKYILHLIIILKLMQLTMIVIITSEKMLL